MRTQNLHPPPPNLPRDGDSRTTRIMTHLKDSIVSQFTQFHPSLSILPHHSSIIQRRLQHLFPAFHTPTHLPYALMIRSAITELKEGPGATEEAISELIERKYNDLPWAHTKILSLQLEKLCKIGEIACAEGGRYVLRVDEEETKQCEGNEKRKRGKQRRNCGHRERSEESEEAQLELLEKQSPHTEAETEAQVGLGESQSQDSMQHLETNCASQPTALKCIAAPAPAQLQLQRPCNGPSEGLDAAAKMSGSLSLNVEECKQDENPMTEHPDHQRRGRRPRNCKQIADYQEESLLPSGDATVTEQEPNEKNIDEPCLSQPQGRGRGRGLKQRLNNAHSINKKLHPRDQAEDLVCSSHSNQKETSSSSQPAAPNSPVNPTHNSGQHLVVPTSEGSPKSIISTGIKLPPNSDIDLGTVSKRKASLTSENVHDDQPQHFNQASPKGNLMSSGSEQKPAKRPRGRPPKLETGANYPLDDDIHNGQRPNINKMEKQHQYGGGRGTRRGRGRPPKLDQNAKQCEEQLHQGDQDQQRDRGRGPGRPPKINGNPIQYEEQSEQEDQAQKHGRGRGRGPGRPPKLIQNTNKCEAQLPQEVQVEQNHVQARGCGRPPKLNQNTNQCEEQLQPQDQAEGLVNSPSSGRDDSQSLERKRLHVQSQGRCHKSVSRRGSGKVSESDVWRLQPIPSRVQGRDGCRCLK